MQGIINILGVVVYMDDIICKGSVGINFTLIQAVHVLSFQHWTVQ